VSYEYCIQYIPDTRQLISSFAFKFNLRPCMKHVIVDEAWIMAGGTRSDKQDKDKHATGNDPRLSGGSFQAGADTRPRLDST
jgi:hypothetical protein